MNLFIFCSLIGLMVLVFRRLRKRDDTYSLPHMDSVHDYGLRNGAIPLAAAATAAAAGYRDAHSRSTVQDFNGTDDDDDWITDPLYSYMPGNIYHHDDTGIGYGHDSTDWVTDPTCSWMSGNIYHHDDTFDSSSGISSSFDDTWNSSSGTTHDDW